MMKRYTVAGLRRRMADALDDADRGVPVIIERRGMRYRLAVEVPKSHRTARRSQIEILDPAVADGDLNWNWSPGCLEFRRRRT